MAQHDKTTDDTGGGTLHAERSGNREITDLSQAEKFLVYRRRNGFSQKQAAKLAGVHRNTYGRLERGEPVEQTPVCPSVVPLTQNETCFLYRRRSGWTQQAVADDMGVTRYWLNLMENNKAPANTLMEYWNEG